MQFNMKQPSFKFSDDVVGINKDETEWAKKNGLIIEKLCKEFMSDTGKTSFRNDLKGFEINRGFFYGSYPPIFSPPCYIQQLVPIYLESR